METRRFVRLSAAVLATAVLTATVWAGETFRLRRGLVLPVRFQQDLSLRENRTGDRFEAIVEDGRDVPYGSRLLGVVVDAQPARDGWAGFMDLEFDTLVLPDGERQRIQAVPIRMDDKSIRKGGDGRFTAKKKLEDSKKHILGGMLGGYLIGKILGHKETEGILFGALAGVILAESERNGSSSEVVIRRDASMGALFERETQFEWETRRDRAIEGQGVEPPAERNASPVLAYEDRSLQFPAEETPFRDGGTWMVPLQQTAEQLGMAVDAVNSRRILVEDDETVLVLEQDSRAYRLNGRKGELTRNVTRRNNVIYVPLDAFFAAKSGRWSVDGTRIEK